MDDNRLTVHTPQEKETLEEYLKRYTDEELRKILSDPILSVHFSETLLNTSEYVLSEPTDELQKLWDQIKYLNNYGRLQHFVQRLKSVRCKLLKSLADNANYIEEYAWGGSFLRLIGSVGDIAGTVGGIWMKGAKFDYSNVAFTAATALGFLGSIATMTEIYLKKNAFDNTMKQMKEDEKRYSPIQLWFQQTETLEKAMLDIFPFDTTQDILRDFVATADRELSGVDLLVKLLGTVIEKDVKHLRNITLIKNLISLSSRSDITDICEWVIFQQNPVFLNISKMVLQFQYSPLKFILCQHIPALSPKEQDLGSVPVWGRIVLNFASILDSLKTLRSSEISTMASEMRYLQEHLDAQLAALERITNYVESRKTSGQL